MELEDILRDRAKIFDRALSGNLIHRVPKIFYDALRWIPLSGGKRLRPTITMLSCEAVGGIPENAILLGISLEYIHNSTLIHDDIIDGDQWRRGLQTTHQKFGTPLAILAGDALIGETFRMLSYMAPPEMETLTYKEIIRSIADATKNVFLGVMATIGIVLILILGAMLAVTDWKEGIKQEVSREVPSAPTYQSSGERNNGRDSARQELHQ